MQEVGEQLHTCTWVMCLEMFVGSGVNSLPEATAVAGYCVPPGTHTHTDHLPTHVPCALRRDQAAQAVNPRMGCGALWPFPTHQHCDLTSMQGADDTIGWMTH